MEYTNELYHFGIKGMKWGVRRYQNKDGTLTAAGRRKTRVSRIQKDSRRLADVSTKYYDAVNKRNALYDTRANMSGADEIVSDAEKTAQKLVKKLEKRYGSVSVIPQFEKNGYVVKSVEASITKIDRRNRVKSFSQSSNPVETYNKWREESKNSDRIRNSKIDEINTKYEKKYRDAVKKGLSDLDIELIELERMEELDKLQ